MDGENEQPVAPPEDAPGASEQEDRPLEDQPANGNAEGGDSAGADAPAAKDEEEKIGPNGEVASGEGDKDTKANGNGHTENGDTKPNESGHDDPTSTEVHGEGEAEKAPEGEAKPDGEGENKAEGEEGEGEAKPQPDEEEKIEAEGEGEKEDDTLDKAAKDNRCLWMINKIEEMLDDFEKDEMWQPDYYKWLIDFLKFREISKLYVWVDLNILQFSTSHNPSHHNQFQMVYFIKMLYDVPITLSNISEVVHTDSLYGDPLDNLLSKMNSDYLNRFLQDKTWPEGVRKDFTSGLHRFMAALTEASHIARGRTTLYIPQEDLSDIEAAAKDKDLNQRLESTVIFWTRQIKDVVSNQESQQSNDNSSSPLDEIDFWTTRTNNLEDLNKQLQKPGLKKICAVLKASDSSYLQSFKDLEAKIKGGSLEASDNLKYLKTLAEPCKKIEHAEPKDIPTLLPEVLDCVRLIWEMSTHYNTDERMKGLLTKISNQIIKRCRAKIDVNDMLEGDVDKCMRDLEESVNCCSEWKRICTHSQEMILKNGISNGRKWNLASDDTIFAENEAFIQRCKDCKDICEGQLQFARKGQGITLPQFGGSKGPEIKKNLEELQEMFQKYLKDIKNLDYDILDVKKTKWHDDYGQKFKENQKSLEIMYRNTALHAFKNITTVVEGVEMLENFHQLAKRQLVKEYIETKAAENVYKLFMDEMKEVEEMYENYTKIVPPMSPSLPKYSGLAIWALSLLSRIERSKKAIDSLFFIPEHPNKQEALDKYEKLHQALDSFITKTQFDLWNKEISDRLDLENIDDKLKSPLLIRTENVKDKLPDSLMNNPIFAKSKDGGFLESNFDKTLLKTLSEGTYWTKLQTQGMVTVNHSVSKLLSQKEALRTMRENVMIIVRDYNKIIESIDIEQKKLFKEHLSDLDRVIENGMTKYKWNSSANAFLANSRFHCVEVFNKVKRFQKNNKVIKNEYEMMGRTTLTSIGKDLYLLKVFLDEQEKVLKNKEDRFSSSFEKINKFLIETYEIFIYQKQDVQSAFLAYVNAVDESILKALKSSVKNTLLDLSKHVKGDSKKSDEAQAFVPIFRVYTCIDPEDINIKIMHEPSAQELREAIEKFIGKINAVTKAIPRLGKIFRMKREEYLDNKKNELLADESGGSRSGGYGRQGGAKYPTPFDDLKDPNLTREEKEERWSNAWRLHEPYQERSPYYDKISRNKNIQDSTTGILEAVENIQTIFYEDAQYWMRNDFKNFYNMRRGIRRILASKDSLDEDPLARYKFYIETVIENIGQVRKESVQKPQLFIQFDNSKLLDTFLGIGNDHINKIYGLIVDESREELESLYNTFETVAEQLKTPSTELKHLKENKDLYEKTMEDLPKLKARIQPIEMKFEYLKSKSQEHQLTEAEHNKLRMVHDAWDRFEEALAEGSQVLAKSQKQLRQEVDSQMDDFRRAAEENKKQFQENAPYSSDKIENQRAKEKIQEYKVLTNDLRDRENKMKFGLDIFKIDHPVYNELSFVEKESEMLTNIWKIKEEWDCEWEKWKTCKFYDLDIQDMDDKAGEFQDMLKNVDREIRGWVVYDNLKNRIESFRQTMPLIMDLRNEAMRERHWGLLRYEVREEFDENSDDFTLDKVFELQLNQHAEFISELSENAAKELKIERQLDKIEYTWQEDPKTDLMLKKETSKGTGEEYYKIETAENIYSVIEEHVVILSNNKSGAFYKQFEMRIDNWEENLAKISEIIELLMVVQSKWGYLESIFTGQQDIMKQLSQEHTIFQGVNAGFKTELERINKDRNALRALTIEGLDKTLEEMDVKLEHIQKNLDDYLKLKRQNFPRFFFLSNEDLLEIMGQSKDPEPMNKHVKKCFEGINRLTFEKQKNRAKTTQITSFSSPDGEEIPLSTPIAGHDKVEDWFKDLLRGMQAQIRGLFKNSTNPFKDIQRSKDKLPEKLPGIIRDNTGQYLLTSCQIEWTREVTTTLNSFERGEQNAGYRKIKNSFLNKVKKYIDYVKKLSDDKRTRNKLVALITIEQHNKDIVDALAKKNITSSKHFEWVQQLKVTREESEMASEPPTIIISQTNCQFEYGYEYQGNNGRLVITPLTDRAYMTLTNALNMCRGGAPQGPAGTGKTETVKDLGKNLAFFVVVQNCSDSLDYLSLGKMFEGLASAGVWGCFDEFNRIEIEVLSVVAQQISTILDAIKRKDATCHFEGSEIPVKHSCGIFITMNPGYAGRTELPDNLKSLFRPVAMMVPGFVIIAKIILMSEGFDKSEELSIKVCKMFDLMRRQLSKQDHYDFSLRAVKSVLSTAGRIKRSKHDQDEFTIMIKAIRDMNLPKLVAEDVILFDHLFIDLFPGIEEPFYENDDLLLAIEDSMTERKLQLNANLAVKIVQLYESKITRHGNMLVGKTLAGKTTISNGKLKNILLILYSFV